MRSGIQEPVVAPNAVPGNSAKFIREDRASAAGPGRLDAAIRDRFVNERRTRPRAPAALTHAVQVLPSARKRGRAPAFERPGPSLHSGSAFTGSCFQLSCCRSTSCGPCCE
jgi:hypothetical protein